jgi:hypothetical protein
VTKLIKLNNFDFESVKNGTCLRYYSENGEYSFDIGVEVCFSGPGGCYALVKTIFSQGACCAFNINSGIVAAWDFLYREVN